MTVKEKISKLKLFRNKRKQQQKSFKGTNVHRNAVKICYDLFKTGYTKSSCVYNTLALYPEGRITEKVMCNFFNYEKSAL